MPVTFVDVRLLYNQWALAAEGVRTNSCISTALIT